MRKLIGNSLRFEANGGNVKYVWRNIQADKELLRIKETLGSMTLKDKEKEQGRAESSTIRSCPVGIHNESRN